MNEGLKTGIFWAVAVVMLGIALFVAWPTTPDDDGGVIAGQMLFEKFTDPLAAASMRIVTFNEEQGQLTAFEVRKDPETELWTIPSRDGYPADALEQMRDAANSLVGLKILDIQTSNAEDHDDLGVVEPKREELQVGDEGVGRLVTMKDSSQETLAALIIGDALRDDPEKRYVRIPGQDPVYVVKLDETPLTTRFQDWIEDDLLQLSSIDIADLEIKDYSAALNGNQVARARSYDVTVTMDGSQWKLESLTEYDPEDQTATPIPVEVDQDQALNKTKLDAMKNALDDLKIVDVVRKPDGMSANLRANQDLLSDKDAVGSLAARGFYPVPLGPKGEVEIMSANGELIVALGDGVQYVMRFGNIAGVTNQESSQTNAEVDAGVNRYLLVTTIVDESKFPPPELKSVPQTLEDLEAILNPQPEQPVDESKSGTQTEAESEADDGESEEDSTEQQPDEQVPADEQLTEEEMQERLEAEQEKITKENQRKLDARKERLELAQRRVRDLNARFADWYYVIPEDTYSQLRIQRDELFETPQSQTPTITAPIDAAGPKLNIPGVPGAVEP